MKVIRRLVAFFKTRQLPVVIGIAIVIALCMTVVSLYLYDINYVSRLDVSRPDRENIRPTTTEDQAMTFDASGALDAKGLTTFQTLYSQSRDDLNKLGTFDGDPLNPDALQSTASTNQ